MERMENEMNYLKIIITGGQLAVLIIFTYLFYRLFIGDYICWYENNKVVALIEFIFFGFITFFTIYQFINLIRGKK